MPRWNLVTAYYLATPVFAVLDLGFGVPVRVWALHDPEQRAVYYAIVILAGLLCWSRPKVAPWVGMLESVVNLFLLMLAVLLPIWSLPDALQSGGPLPRPLGALALVNVALSGTILVTSFQRGSRLALGTRKGGFG